MTNSSDVAVISGIGISSVGRRTGIAGIDLTATAAQQAIEDAGLEPGDIDGMATMGDTPIRQAALRLGVEANWWGGGFDTGGLLSPMMSACKAVTSGHARHVLVYRTVQMMGGSILPGNEAASGSESASGKQDQSTSAPPPVLDWMGPLLTMHAYSAANWVAMHCRRHMHLYGTTREQLGWVAVNARKNAGLNQLAAYREPLSLDDYFDGRLISDPFGLYDCDVPVDGSIALVVSRSDHAAGLDHHAIRVESYGGSSGEGGWDQRPDYPAMASSDAASQMWSRTSLRPADVDIAELYDGFTFLTLAWLEALGICRPGESGPFVEGGDRIALDGELPLNTYGGQLSAGRMHGYWVLHEAVLQLRGQAGERQVAGAQVAVAAAGGGPIAGCLLMTR